MKKVTAFGGIFFKSDAPKDLMAWYDKHLGLGSDAWGGKSFEWRDKDNPETQMTAAHRVCRVEPPRSQTTRRHPPAASRALSRIAAVGTVPTSLIHTASTTT